MAYNKKNYYQKIIRIQQITEEQKFVYGLTYKEIFYKYIEPQFHISFRTFETYIGVPAKRELKKLLEKEKTNGDQLTFNF